MGTTKEKVEEWIAKAPQEIDICPSGCDIEEVTETTRNLGTVMPAIVKGGYRGKIEFVCKDWEEK